DLSRARPAVQHVLVLLRFSGYSDARSFLRVRGSGPWPTRLVTVVCRNNPARAQDLFLSLTFSAHGDGAAMFIRTGGSPDERTVPWGRWCPGWLLPCSAWLRVWGCRLTQSLATASAAAWS